MSAKSRNIGKDFEERIETTFAAYAKANIAYLSFMPVPTRAVMMQGSMVRVGNGAAPFDVYGFIPRNAIERRGVRSLSSTTRTQTTRRLRRCGTKAPTLSPLRI
jgi:hypothetical protein